MRAILLGCAVALAWLPAASRGQELYYIAALSGAAASPPNSSAATGTAVVYVDLSLLQLHIDLTFSGLAGQTTGANIYGLTAAPGTGLAAPAMQEPTLPGFAPLVTQGLYHGVLELTSDDTYSGAFLANFGGTAALARNALLFGLDGGHIYFSIATASYPSGEIRGFLAPAPTADFSHNGRVDGADLNLWRLGFGPSAFADADHDSQTNGDDFLLWQRQLGQVAQIPEHHHVAPTGSAIPEPVGLAIAAIGCGSFAALRRRSPR